MSRTVEYLRNITIGERSVYNRANVPHLRGRVQGFKIVNLYSEIQTDPEGVDVYDKYSMEDPEVWSGLCNDYNCVAICAAWGEIRRDHLEVSARRLKVAEWLNRKYSGKVGTLGLSRAGYPYHPNSDVFRPPWNKRPEFKIKPIPEI